MNQTPFIRADSTPHVFVSADYREHTMTKIVPVRETSGVPQVTGDFARYVEQKEELQWHHNERDGVSNHQPHDCLLKRLCRHRSKKISKLWLTGLCAGNSTVTGEFPAQRASNGENVSIWWRHHESTPEDTLRQKIYTVTMVNILPRCWCAWFAGFPSSPKYGPVFCDLLGCHHRAGYFSNLACDWLSIIWTYSEQETENRRRSIAIVS